MPVVVNVRFRYSSSDCLAEISDSELEIHRADHLLVETEKGKDVALAISEPEEIAKENLPEDQELGLVKRIACENDFEHVQDLVNRGKEAMSTFRTYIQQNELEMNPIAIHFLFDGSRGIFYFTAKERVDFRALVHDLAGYFHMRIDMRQVGIRDEARMLGGYGMCGEELCCARMAGKLEPVSIRMAKVQDLSLNPTKISGLCGRLMCCLNYELEAYDDFKSRAPQKNDLVETPLGTGKVVDYNTPLETVTLRMEDGSQLVVPLKEMDCDGKRANKNGEHPRPCHVSQEALDRINEELHRDKTLAMMGKRLFSTSPELADKEAGSSAGQKAGVGQKASVGEKAGAGQKTNARQRSSSSSNSSNSNNSSFSTDNAGSAKGADKKRRNRRADKQRKKDQRFEDEDTDFQSSTRKSRFTKRRHRVLSDSDNVHEVQAQARAQARTGVSSGSGSSGSGGNGGNGGSGSNSSSSSNNAHERRERAKSSRVRPGQHSSGISGDDFGSGVRQKSNSQKNNGERPAQNKQNKKGRKPRRKRRLS